MDIVPRRGGRKRKSVEEANAEELRRLRSECLDSLKGARDACVRLLRAEDILMFGSV